MRNEAIKESTNLKSALVTGLSDKEAKKRYSEHGANVLVEKKKISKLKILLDQFSDFMVIILLASTVVSIIMGEITESITIISIVILNAILGYVQEYRTEKTMDALKELTAPTAKVIRDGRQVIVPAEQIVPGDLLVFEAGDRIPADALLMELNSLFVDESLLTGESVPVEKIRNNHIFMGTIVTAGKGKALVSATGMKTEMGKIADMIQNIDEEETPLQKKLDHLGKIIGVGCLGICAVVSVTGILRGESALSMLIAGISLAVAAVPEGLPAIVTISLALGVQRMLKRNALVRRLPAVETLGCANVICSDKTGTLTENRMTVRKIYAGESIIEVKGDGSSSDGNFILNDKEVSPLKYSAFKLALEIGGVCNNAILEKTSTKSAFSRKITYKINGDPTEGALLIAAAKAGLDSSELSGSYRRFDEIPFDSDRKCMSVICDGPNKETLVLTKGAPDIIIRKCSKLYTANGIINLSPIATAGILGINDKMANAALRVIGVAYKKVSNRNILHNEAEKDLIFVGLIGMIDPPRKEAADAVLKCRMAGIKPVMITGDHKGTAAAIARELGILGDGDKILTGEELEKMNETDIVNTVGNVSVYARVSPKHKHTIVKSLKKLGHIVAMTGDGVNDAPAIKEADIGVSMGITGTDVTKEASSMVLVDDNFATIVAAIEEGRVIYSNIRKFIRYLLSCNLGEVLTMFVGMLLGLPVPLLPIQILWVNLVTDGLPAIALGFDPPEKDIMMRKPRGVKDNIFSHGLSRLIIFRGVLIGVCTLSVFTTIMRFTGHIPSARTGAFATLVITQLVHVFECKSERKQLFDIPVFNNILLVLAVLCSITMLLIVIYIPALNNIFKTVALGMNEWVIILGFSALGPAISGLLGINVKK